jgi:hypothetical protein
MQGSPQNIFLGDSMPMWRWCEKFQSVLISASGNDVKNVVLAWYRYAQSCHLCCYVAGYQEQLQGNLIYLLIEIRKIEILPNPNAAIGTKKEHICLQ